ncbi:MAG: TetR/AcrR family transcriptional regulator [Anaerolineae bacterium]|jgi:AcrR family transcriptional regulator
MGKHRQPSRRERKKLETRQRLMEVALQLFGEHGYEATTVKDITSVADVAKGTFFNYFETKEAILPAIAARRLEQLEELLTPAQGAPDSAVARIKLALRLVAESPLCQEKLAEQLFAAMIHRREIGPGHALRDLLAEQVHQAQAVGEIRSSLDPMYLAGVIHALFFQRLVMWHHGYRSVPLRDLIDGSVDLLMEGAAGPNWKRTS